MDFFSKCCAPASNGTIATKLDPVSDRGHERYANWSPPTSADVSQSPSPRNSGRPPSSGMSTERCGVGIMFETELDKEHGCCRVEGIAQYSEAYESRILEKGDLLWEVNGKSAAHKSLPELSCMIMGPPGSKVDLTFRKPTGEIVTTSVTRISPLSILNKSNRTSWQSQASSAYSSTSSATGSKPGAAMFSS